MAKYAISQEGIDALQTLSSRLVESTSSIDDASKVLYSTIEGVSDGLGVYEKDIYILLRDVINTNQKGKKSVNQLTKICHSPLLFFLSVKFAVGLNPSLLILILCIFILFK